MSRSDINNRETRSQLNNELEVFDFSHYPLPLKSTGTIRIFYNNINGLEINTAVAAVVNNKKKKNKHEYTDDHTRQPTRVSPITPEILLLTIVNVPRNF